MTEFRLLGSLEVAEDGHLLALGSRRQRALLCLLLLRANEVVSRDALIDGLWGERPPETAANALQVQVHGLRKRLGPDRIVTEGAGYRLRVDPGELDVVRFERLVARGRGELASGVAERASATLAEALSLWRGPALADVAYDAFAQGEVARLEEARLAAVEERVEADLALGRHHDLAAELEAHVSSHPLRERLQGQLMLALYRCGRQGDALAVFRRARRHLRDKLGLEPGPELRELQRAILRQDGALRLERPELRGRRHLPASYTPLVGRRAELDEVGGLLRSEGVRLLTLTGPGGTGKTRVALQAAHELADAFADGVYFVDLAHLREPELVPSAIAHALGVHEQGEQDVRANVQAWLRDRRLLLLLDNFEVVDEAAPLLGELLSGASGLALLVTSRTPLRLSGEYVYRVPPLPLEEAAQLFVVRARAVAPGFRRASEEAEEVSELCRRLDCLPLAIELAAARTREHAPAEMLVLLPSALELASGGARDLPERQKTMRAAIDWSHELLGLDEQALFARLAVFAGGWTVAAAERVCGASRSALASLVSKSLLYERPGRDGEPRFLMLETVREYALERLRATGDADLVRRRHAEYWVAYTEAAEDVPVAPGQEAWPELEEENDNLRTALAWTHETDADELELRLAGALGRFWVVRGHLREGLGWIEAALREGKGSPPSRAKALVAGARLALSLGDYPRMQAFAEDGLAAYRSLDDRSGVAQTLDLLATATSNQGDLARATTLNEQAAAIYRELGDGRGLASSLANLGYLALVQGEYEQAIARNAASLAIFEQLGRRDAMPLPLANLGLAASLAHRPGEALARFRQGIELARELGYKEALVYCLEGLAALLAAAGDAEQAATLLGASEAVSELTGLSLEPFERGAHERTIDAIAAALDPDALAAAWAAGRQLTSDDAAAFALTLGPSESVAANRGQ